MFYVFSCCFIILTLIALNKLHDKQNFFNFAKHFTRNIEMILPEMLVSRLRDCMGSELFSRLEEGMAMPPSVSIRLNMAKQADSDVVGSLIDGTVEWCPEGRYLSQRPNFTMDPLLHAGAYYVQESSSMFITHVLRQLIDEPVLMLDLCAAPGGKTTAARSVLPEGSVLVSNEVVAKRAQILCENVWKWGHPDVVVTQNRPIDFQSSPMMFDVVLCDAPCSGEGMMRKDETARSQWSPQLVTECAQLQRQIVSDIWPCLREGGIMIYSTCTFNTTEDEDNLNFIADELGADGIIVNIGSDWGITMELKGRMPAYRFLPGLTRGEGLFMGVLRKRGGDGQTASAYNSSRIPAERLSTARLRVLSHGPAPAVKKGKAELPHHSSALAIGAARDNIYNNVEIDRPTAISYLARESICLPSSAPRGIVRLTYKGLPIGYAKNIGSRANNLYPQEWRIRTKSSM